MHLQFTRSVVGILDGISDWPEEVVQEQSSAYVYNNHPQLCTTAYEIGVLLKACISVYGLYKQEHVSCENSLETLMSLVGKES